MYLNSLIGSKICIDRQFGPVYEAKKQKDILVTRTTMTRGNECYR